MEKLVVKGTISEVVETMEGKGYHMEGFNEVSIKAKYFYAYKADYQGADYFSIKYKNGQYILTQF
jgi:hypothetical protein